MAYIKNVLIGVDQLVNTIFAGAPDETISARAFRCAKDGKRWAISLQWVLNLVFTPISRTHCLEAYISELERLQLPPSYWVYTYKQ